MKPIYSYLSRSIENLTHSCWIFPHESETIYRIREVYRGKVYLESISGKETHIRDLVEFMFSYKHKVEIQTSIEDWV